jgi:hypothetical protein
MPKLASQLRLGSTPTEVQSDLAAIVYAMGDARKFLANRQRWYEACRDPKEYRPLSPYLLEDEMLSDAAKTVVRCGTEAEKQAVRNAIVQYFATRSERVLGPLQSIDTTDVLKLCTDEIKENAEAGAAILTALNTKSPSAFEVAERESLEAVSAMERVRDGLSAARARFITPRTTRLFAGGAR